MCGRFTQQLTWSELVALYRITHGVEPPQDFRPSFNVAPTQRVPVVRAGADDGRELVTMRWGLTPSWAKDPAGASKMINARVETVAEKPAYRAAFRKRRCLVPASGFYEWKAGSSGKTPHHIVMRARTPFAFAGIWEAWRPPEGDPLESVAIITGSPNELVATIHDRMPMIVAPAAYDLWLSSATDPTMARALLEPFPAGAMEAYPVSRRVNSPQNNDEACIAVEAVAQGAT